MITGYVAAMHALIKLITAVLVRLRPLPSQCGNSTGKENSLDWHKVGGYRPDLSKSQGTPSPLQRGSHSLSEGGLGELRGKG